MVSNIIPRETALTESGESPAIALENNAEPLTVTLEITHAVEHESIDVQFFLSEDGKSWKTEPAATFAQKSYCGAYELTLFDLSGKFLKASWKLSRWGKDRNPFFRISLTAETPRTRALVGGASA